MNSKTTKLNNKKTTNNDKNLIFPKQQSNIKYYIKQTLNKIIKYYENN